MLCATVMNVYTSLHDKMEVFFLFFCSFPSASPARSYDGVEERRYFIISTPNTPVHLPCAIQPGALAERYAVSWTLQPPQDISDNTFVIQPVVSPEELSRFICNVTIEHRAGIMKEYAGPLITVNTTGETFNIC